MPLATVPELLLKKDVPVNQNFTKLREKKFKRKLDKHLQMKKKITSKTVVKSANFLPFK